MWLLFACASPTMPESRPEMRPRPSPHASRARRVRTLDVDCAGGAAYRTIEDALDDARSGDRISVAPCTYEGSISFKGKAVLIESTSGAAVTTIVGMPGEPVIKSKHGEGAGTEIAGFTITGGGGEVEPAIEVQFSALTLRDDIVSGNTGTVTLLSKFGHVVVERTLFEENTASEGFVVQEWRGMTVLKDSVVRCGAVGIGYLTEHSAAFADGTTFDCPGAVGMEIYHSDGRVQRSVVDGLLRIENEGLEEERAVVEDTVLLGGATLETAGVTLRNVVSLDAITVTNSTVVVEGSVITGASCGIDATASTVTFRNVDFWENVSDTCGLDSPVGVEGSFSEDPMFVDLLGRDFRLAAGSPCLDTGPVGFGYDDPDGTPNDIGAYGGPLSLGGGW